LEEKEDKQKEIDNNPNESVEKQDNPFYTTWKDFK